MIAKLRSWWLKIKQHPYVTSLVVVLVLILFTFLAYRFGWDWTGFTSGTNQITITSTSKVNYTATLSQPSKSLWDWLQLLAVLAIPVVVGLGAAWYTAHQAKVSDRENTDNQRATALQVYIDKMSELILVNHLHESKEGDKVRQIARVRTITILCQLDGKRIGYITGFLRETGLVSNTPGSSIVSLSRAELSEVDWRRAYLWEANLAGAILSGADLRGAYLKGANLAGADLSGANLKDATGITIEELEKQAESLKGAVMPDGSKHA